MANPATQTEALIEAVARLLASKYAHASPSLYLHGSRRTFDHPDDSDIDITAVLAEASWQIHLGNDLRNLALDLPVALDATIYTVGALNAPENGYEAGRLLNASILISGPDIRPQLRADSIDAAHCRRVVEQARKGIALLRGIEQVPDHLEFPDVSAYFYGYDVVRKPSGIRQV